VFISEAFAQAAPAAGGDSPFGSLGSMLPLVLMFVVLYFVMIRPQMKRQKEAKALIDGLAKGDEVITTGGMLGKISKIGETYLTVEIASGIEIQVQRAPSCRCCPRAPSPPSDSPRGPAHASRAVNCREARGAFGPARSKRIFR